MAGADYRRCDVCGCKAFYDANLNYEFDDLNGEKVRDRDYQLDYVGDWAVICTDCAKTHKCIIERIPEGKESNG